jgi:hypothetical protein
MPGAKADLGEGLWDQMQWSDEPAAVSVSHAIDALPQPQRTRLSLGPLDDRAKAERAQYADSPEPIPFDLNDTLANTSQMYRIENQRRAMKQRLDEEWAAAEARGQAEGREIAMAGPAWVDPWFVRTNATPDGDLPPIAPRPNDPGDPWLSQVPAQPRMEDPAAGAAAPRPQAPAAGAEAATELAGAGQALAAAENLRSRTLPAAPVERMAASDHVGHEVMKLRDALADDAIQPGAVHLGEVPASQKQPSGNGLVTATLSRPDPAAPRSNAMPVSTVVAPPVVPLEHSPALRNALSTASRFKAEQAKKAAGRREQKPPSAPAAGVVPGGSPSGAPPVAAAPRADGGTSSARKKDGDDNGWMLPVLGGAGLLGAGAVAGLTLPHIFGGNSQPNPQTPAR